jgi:hypothetical protein
MSFTSTAWGQADCNNNGVDDGTDIANGSVTDCDENGVPDDCEARFVVDRSIPATGVPLGLVSADFNNDGFRDLAFVRRDQGGVVVVFGAADGSFSQQIFGVGSLPVWAAAANLNGDQLPDLAVANAGSNTVSILLNTGQGGAQAFAPATTIPVGTTPIFILAVDLDTDGDQDLVVAQDGPDTVRKLLNDGSGGFVQGGLDDAVGSGPSAIASGPFNSGDTLPDLAITNSNSNNLTVLLNGGTPPAATNASFSTPFFLAAGDFNSDGRSDLAVANFSSGRVLVLTSSGDGSFAPGQELTGLNSPAFVSTADVNQDGRLDLIVADASGVLLYLGNGNATFALSQRGQVGSGINSLVRGTFFGSVPQIAALDQDAQQIYILRSEGPECAQPAPEPPAAGCGAGACGAGGATAVPFTLAGLMLMRRRRF